MPQAIEYLLGETLRERGDTDETSLRWFKSHRNKSSPRRRTLLCRRDFNRPRPMTTPTTDQTTIAIKQPLQSNTPLNHQNPHQASIIGCKQAQKSTPSQSAKPERSIFNSKSTDRCRANNTDRLTRTIAITTEWLIMTMTRVVENGVEFFTINETGESGMSISGVARLCAVSETSIRSFLSRNAVRTLDAKKRLEVFQEEGFHFEPSWWKRITIVSSDICANIIEHYAYESKQKRTAEALFAYRKFAKMGIEAWIQGITGWRKEPLEPQLPDLTLPREAVRILKNAQESKTAYRLFLHLHDVGQLGDRPTIAKICSDLQITRPTFYKTAKRLRDLSLLPDWFELESRNYPERILRDWLHGELGGTIEAPTVYGPIDLLTKEEVIEVKRIEDWKEAIGHVVVKGSCYPDRFKCLFLFGEKLRNVSLIEESCDRLGIQVGFQRVKYIYDSSDDLLDLKRLRYCDE